jgi:hypothetical protein
METTTHPNGRIGAENVLYSLPKTSHPCPCRVRGRDAKRCPTKCAGAGGHDGPSGDAVHARVLPVVARTLHDDAHEH